jgi:hypothetical protein
VVAFFAAVAVRSSLKAAQKLVAPPMTAFCGVPEALGLAEVVLVGELFAVAEAELVPVGEAELDLVAVVDGVELATLLDPEEHPASTPTITHMRASRRIVTTPLLWSYASPEP